MATAANVDKPPLHGVAAAMLAAILFGASTVLAKRLLGQFHPVILAGIFYFGSGLGLGGYWLLRQRFSASARRVAISRQQWPWLGGAILAGGIVGPVLLMIGLHTTPASTASLLLNMEAVFTAGLAWFAFHEHFDRRIMLGMLLIIIGGFILSWSGRPALGVPWGPLLIVAACACWGLDNNLTRNVSDVDPIVIAALKGAIAGSVNLALGFALRVPWPGFGLLTAAALVGLFGYGISLVLFVLALRQVGTARTGAYFSTGPFFGALFSLSLLHEPVTVSFEIATACMAVGIWLHLTERHRHEHLHTPMTHTHKHVHDAHHQHEHAAGIDPHEAHTHEHAHGAFRHTHAHFPDSHHRHPHP